MKKKLALILSLCILGSVFSPVIITKAEETAVDLDYAVSADQISFTSSPYFTPAEYVRTNNTDTISIKSSAPAGTITLGYHGAAYLNETLAITAKFGGTFSTLSPYVWDAFYIRAQGNGTSLPVGNFALDKYMFTIPNSRNIQLYRMNNKNLTYLSPSTVPETVDLTVENSYEISAVNTSNSVQITMRINGITVLSYNDVSADRIVTAGYFGVAASENDSTITIGKKQVTEEIETIELDAIISSNPAAFTSPWPYFTSDQYVKTVENSTISIKSTVVGGGIQMGYEGSAYLNENLKFTAKFGGDFATGNSWDAFYLRSQVNGSNPPLGAYSKDKYIFTIPNTKNIQLHRVNGGVMTYLAPSTIPANLDLAAENVYEICASNRTGSVTITMKINGVTVISYIDTSASRITAEGYFGVADYGNSSTITIGKKQVVAPVVEPTEPTGTIIKVDLDSKAETSTAEFTSSPYLAPSQYERNDGNSLVVFKGTTEGGTVAMGYHGAAYLNQKIAVTARFDGTFKTMSENVWNGFYLRSQNNGSNMPMDAFSQDKYLFTFKNTNQAALYRVNSGALTQLAIVQIPASVDLSKENLYELMAVTYTASVDVFLKINGSKVIAFRDLSANRISREGYFGVTTYANTSTIKLGKFKDESLDPMPDVTKVDLANIIGNPREWLVSAPGLLKLNSGILSFKGYEAMASYTRSKYTNAMFTMQIKGIFTDPTYAWISVNLRSKKAGSLPMAADNQSYQLAIHGTRLVLYKNLPGVAATVLAQAATDKFGDRQFQKLEYGTQNEGGGVRILVRVNGKTLINVLDTKNAILESGYLTLTSYLNNEMFIKYGAGAVDDSQSPGTTDLYDAYIFFILMMAFGTVIFYYKRARRTHQSKKM